MAIGAALRTLGRAERQLGLDGAAEQTLGAALSLLVDIRVLPEALDVLVEQAELLVRRRAAARLDVGQDLDRGRDARRRNHPMPPARAGCGPRK